jgi:Ni/Fe-hydrogenase subunit HybB-like protein
MTQLSPRPVLDYSTGAAAPRSFIVLTVSVLCRPSLAFRWETGLPRAIRFARVHALLAALMLGIAAHLYIAYLSRWELFGTTTGHWSDGWFWIPLTILGYALFAAASEFAQRRLNREGGFDKFQAAGSHRRSAALLHTAQLLPPAVVIVSTVLILYRLNYSRTIDASHPAYPVLLIAELIMGAAYVIVTFRVASRCGDATAGAA